MIGLQCTDLTKVFKVGKRKHTVLDKANLSVKKGERLAVLGKNGAGKSTLIKLIGGVEHLTSGHIKRNMTISWPLAFGGAFQGSLSGYDNLRFICRVYDLDYKETLDYVEDFAQLGKQFYDPVKTYSSGMQARLGFALSLAIEFDCYLIDEVIMVGDIRFSRRCEEELLVKRKERTLIIVSHQTNYLRETCDRAVLLDGCKIHNCSSVDEGIKRYESL